MSAPSVKGLFLSGGQSQRMGVDKALLRYRASQTEVERWKNIFEELGLPFFWSQRSGQYPLDLYPHIPRLMDETPGFGPLGALVSAHRLDPASAWLVLACDWPLLEAADLVHLLQNRRPDLQATAYIQKDRLQPLCCLYEPGFLHEAAAAWQVGQQSLNRLLESAATAKLEGLDTHRFLNANDPKARDEAHAAVRREESRNHPHRNGH